MNSLCDEQFDLWIIRPLACIVLYCEEAMYPLPPPIPQSLYWAGIFGVFMRDEDVSKFTFKRVKTHIFIDHQLTKNTTLVLQLTDGKQDFFSFPKKGEVISLSQTKCLHNSKRKLKKNYPSCF